MTPLPGNCDIVTAQHMLAMKDQAIVCNIGHFDNEIQVDQLKKTKGVHRTALTSRSTIATKRIQI